MEFMEDFKAFVSDFVETNSKRIVAVTVTIIVFVILAVSLFFVQAAKEEAAQKNKAVFGDSIPYSAVEDFFPPAKQHLTNDYYFLRNQGNKWDDEEFNRWFSVPNKSNVDELGESNNKIADEIIGAAP